jgi:hypothetical protein
MEEEIHPILQKFRRILNDFKRPYIEKTEEFTENGGIPGEERQNVGALEDIFKNIEMLYYILEPILRNGGKIDGIKDIHVRSVLQPFEVSGIFPALRADPSLKEGLLRCIQLDLRMYPYTLNTKHVKELALKGVESHQKEIIPNIE